MRSGRATMVAALTVVVALSACSSDPPVARLTDPSATFAEPGLAGPPKLSGKPLPDGTFTRFDGGGDATFASLRGAPAIINFWSRTCAPCVQEMPVLDALAQRLGTSVRVVGLDSGDALAAARTFADGLGVRYELWLDDDRAATVALGVTALPTTVFVDAEGTIVRTHLGAFEAAALDTTVKEVFGL